MSPLKLRVDMHEILDAMGAPDGDFVRRYLDLETGRVVPVSDDELVYLETGQRESEPRHLAAAVFEHPHRYSEIPKYAGRDEYELMARFAEGVQDGAVRELLAIALGGKGSFARFREVVFRYPDMKARWFAIRQDAMVKQATGWLTAHGLEPVYDLRVGSGHDAALGAGPRSARKTVRGTSVDLLELLLLGSPAPRPESLRADEGAPAPSGVTLTRSVHAPTPSEARALFESLARDLARYYGMPWNDRYVAASSTFNMERACLRVAGRRVEMRIDVPASVYRLFSPGSL
jgi:hypothetical protein